MIRKALPLIAGPLAAIGAIAGIEISGHPDADAMLGVALWMAIWWLSECVPLALTALLPLVLFPLLGIADGHSTAPKYINSIIFLFLGGFLIAQAMENTGLHKRIALAMLARLHASPIQLVIGFSLATALLSMWISNTATTMLMMTIALPLLRHLQQAHGHEAIAPLALTLMLTIAYSANIGGMGTPVGTAPNLVFLENMRVHAPSMTPSFLQWMMVGIPVVLAGLAILWLWLLPPLCKMDWQRANAAELERQQQALGRMRREEKYVAWVLAITAMLWMSRKGIRGEDWSIPGWGSLLPAADDGTVAIAMASLLFLLSNGQGGRILAHNAFRRLPWDIVLLLGGGFALASGMQQSGLSAWLGDQLAFFAELPLPLTILGIVLVLTFLTEITSNTATTQVMLPILAAAALSNHLDPLLILVPATLAASCAFMLPVATPPNAIVFGSGHLHLRDMARMGLRMNLAMAPVIAGLVWLLRPWLPPL